MQLGQGTTGVTPSPTLSYLFRHSELSDPEKQQGQGQGMQGH